MNNPKSSEKVLQQVCAGCGTLVPNASHNLYCPKCGRNALVVSDFDSPLKLNGTEASFSSYDAWLSFKNEIGIPGPEIGCVRSKELGKALGLSDLWVLISGYSPKFGSTFVTGTFKECEAIGVLNRVREQTNRILIVSSAGNAGRAFLELGARYNEPAIVIMPESVDPIITVEKLGPRAPLLLRVRDAFYVDVIRFVDRLIEVFPSELVREGGCFNTARRDSMAVPFLRAVQAMEGLPDYYVQAVGSGTGAIATWEAAQRLRAFNQSGLSSRQMRLLLVQNEPFAPMVNAWQSQNVAVEMMPDDVIRAKLSETFASVLSNANPPYQIRGGVRDVLTNSDGLMCSVTNREIQDAQELARKILDFEPCPAASTAMAGLIKSVRNRSLSSQSRVLLHLTGGGLAHLRHDLGGGTYSKSISLGLDDDEAAVIAIKDYLKNVH